MAGRIRNIILSILRLFAWNNYLYETNRALDK